MSAARRAFQSSQSASHAAPVKLVWAAGQMAARFVNCCFKRLGLAPFQLRLGQIELVFGILRREGDGAFQPFARLALAADAERPAGRLKI